MTNDGVNTIVAGMNPSTADEDFALFEAVARVPQTAAREAYQNVFNNNAEQSNASGWQFDASEAASVKNDESAVSSKAPSVEPSSPANSVASSSKSSPNLFDATEMLKNYEQRRSNPVTRTENLAASTVPVPNSFSTMFKQMCANRSSGNTKYATETRPLPTSSADPNYYERRELCAKIDDLRQLGFSMPSSEELRSATLEDLQSEVRRGTTSVSTISNVQSIIGMINSGAKWIELMNSVFGNMIPLPENYAKEIEESTKTPRFKYAIYQLVLKYSNNNKNSGPWKEILIVLFLPVVQAIAAKLIIYFSKGRIPLTRSHITNGIGSFFKFAGQKVLGDPNDGGGVFDAPNNQEKEEEVIVPDDVVPPPPSAEYLDQEESDEYDSDDSLDGPPPSLRSQTGNFIVPVN